MGWLGGWLREIILVVLLASFVELLLPSKSMERYARLVLSLLILLTMLSPIVSLLKGDAVAELSLAMGQQEKEGGLFSGSGQNDTTLEKILADGQKLAEGRQEQSLKLAAEEVASQMREQIISETGTRGVNVTVTLRMGLAKSGSEDIPVISAVMVSLPATTSEGAASSGASGVAVAEPIIIAPVEAVEIKVGDGEKSKAVATTESDATANGNEADAAKATSEIDSIVKLLEQKWDLDPEVIQVQDHSGDVTKS